MKKLTEGKSKIIYDYGNDILMRYKGDVRCSNQKVVYNDIIARERVRFTYHVFKMLHEHFSEIILPEIVDDYTLKMKKVKPIPLEWIPRYVAAGSVVKRFGFTEGYRFKKCILKIDYKTEIDDYLIPDDLIVEKRIISFAQLIQAKELCYKIAECLKKYCDEHEMELWDFKMELGEDKNGNIVLIDEISLDGMRIKDSRTKKDYDKDLYRKTGKLNELIKAYNEGYNRLFN